MPIKKDVLDQKKDQVQVHVADTADFMEKYDQMETEEKQYIAKLLEVARNDPKAFTYGTMQYNGFQKEQGKWQPRTDEELKQDKNISPKLYQRLHPDDEKQPQLSRMQAKINANSNRDYKRDAKQEPNSPVQSYYDSKPKQSYGFLGNLIYRASYMMSYNAVSAAYTVKEKTANLGAAFKDSKNQAKNDFYNGKEISPSSEELRQATNELVKGKDLKQAFNQDYRANQFVSQYLGFKNILKPELENNTMLDKMNKVAKPTAPSYMNMRKSSKMALDQIDKYNQQEPKEYFANLHDIQESHFTNDNKEKINFVIAKGDVSNGKLLTRHELKNSVMTDPSQKYTLSFSDGLAKEYANRDKLAKDLEKNSPKEIHKGVEKSFKANQKEEQKVDVKNNSKNLEINDLKENKEKIQEAIKNRSEKMNHNQHLHIN